MRNRLRQLFDMKETPYEPPVSIFSPARARHLLKVAWHVREGDITLNSKAIYLNTLSNEVQIVLSGNPHAIFVFSERPLSNKFNFTSFQNITFVHDLDVPSTLHHLIHSDVLITSGSSFASVAALYFKGSIVLQAPVKEPFGVYQLGGEGIIAPNGTLVYPSCQEIHERISLHWHGKEW